MGDWHGRSLPAGGRDGNVFFQVDDAEEEWTFSSLYDLIHLRNLAGSFRDWQAVYEQCYRHLKPGGYIEVVDNDHLQAALVSAPDSHLSTFVEALGQASRQAGRPYGTEHLQASLFEAAGFVQVTTTVKQLPIGPWPAAASEKTLGKMWLIALIEGAEGGSLRLLTRNLGWKAEQVLELCQKLKGLLSAPDLRLSTPM